MFYCDCNISLVLFTTIEKLERPFVEYTLAVNEWTPDTTMTNAANSYTYEVPQNWYPTWSGMMYETSMLNLKPGKTTYKYRVGGYCNQTLHTSKEFVFNTAPLADKDQKTTFAMLGDQGTFMLLGFAVTEKIVQLQEQEEIDIVHYAGDLSYAGLSGDLTPFNNISDDDEFGHIWDLWGIQNERIHATRPVMTTPGNHESFYNWTAFSNRYHMPYKNSNGEGNFDFSYDYGNVHITSINTEGCYDMTCPQMQWLEADLQTAVANRLIVPWLVLSLHRPIYSSDASSSGVPGGELILQRIWRPFGSI